MATILVAEDEEAIRSLLSVILKAAGHQVVAAANGVEAVALYRSSPDRFDLVVTELPPPDLLIYLRASVPVLMQRIGKRGRNIESGISAEYLTLLDRYYDEWLRDFSACPVLMIESDNLDFVHRADHLDVVVARIEDRLSGKERLVFPS